MNSLASDLAAFRAEFMGKVIGLVSAAKDAPEKNP